MQYLPLSAAFLLLSSTAAAQSFKVTPPAAGEYLCTLVPPVPVVVAGPKPFAAVAPGFSLVKNWDFGTDGNIKDVPSLEAEFTFHDVWNTINLGGKYGSDTAAPTAASVLPGVGQLVRSDVREFVPGVMKAYVRPKDAAQTTVGPWSKHDAVNGSIAAKYQYAPGPRAKDILWETRVRISKPVESYWFALWAAGTKWDKGAEMDVAEAFSTPWTDYTKAAGFHIDSIGGVDAKACWSDWWPCLRSWDPNEAHWNLTDFHVFSWVYRKDDTYVVYVDNRVFQQGTISWKANGEPINLAFMFDFAGNGDSDVWQVNNLVTPVAQYPIVYEIDWSRVYER